MDEWRESKYSRTSEFANEGAEGEILHGNRRILELAQTLQRRIRRRTAAGLWQTQIDPSLNLVNLDLKAFVCLLAKAARGVISRHIVHRDEKDGQKQKQTNLLLHLG